MNKQALNLTLGLIGICIPNWAWGQDSNGDGIPDTREDQCLTYQNSDYLASFSSSTLPPYWAINGQSYLTSGIDDIQGEGVLRLTPLSTGKMGGARSQLAFDKGDGVVIDFAINSWGGTGADGMAFFLYDASTDENNFLYGGNGSTFAYFNGTAGGLTGGVLAIGFDEYGNFSLTSGGNSSNPNSIVLVGDKFGTTNH